MAAPPDGHGPRPKTPPPRPGPGLTVMTYNVGNGLARPGPLVALLREAGADVVGLQELAADQAQAIREGLGGVYPHQVLHPGGFAGKGLLSRFPLHEGQQLHLYPDRPDLRVRVELPGPGPDPWPDPGVIPGDALTVVVAHPPPPRVGWRGLVFSPPAMAQIDALIRLVAAHPPGVLMGDFNMTAGHAVYTLLRRGGLRDAFSAAGRGRGATLPTRVGQSSRVRLRLDWARLVPLARVDYIWHTPDLAALDCWVGAGDAGSDHLPVLARLGPAGAR